MEIRQAILKAADHIEANPALYDFGRTTVPDCGTPGCLVGWIGHFMGVGAGTFCWNEAATRIIGVDAEVFVKRMMVFRRPGDGAFTREAGSAARRLRAYADKYHPEPERETYPEINRELDRIFSTEVA